MQLTGKRVLITGSTSGIGLGCARVCARAGASIILHGLISTHQAVALQRQFERDYSVPCHVNTADLADSQAIQSFCENITSELGAVDVLVNNAGIQYISPVDALPLDKWQQVIAINLTAVFLMSKYLLAPMIEQGWGRIINIASTHGLVASVNKAAYVATKHGVIGFTKTLALEQATSGITVNAICPGWVDTELVAKQYQALAQEKHLDLAEAQKQLLLEKQPNMQFIQTEDIGALIVFLSSNAAAGITGTSVPIDGGWTAR